LAKKRKKKEEPEGSGSSGDKVVYAFTQALRRVTRPTILSLSEPRYKQDLSANPKRTAKLSNNFDLLDESVDSDVQKI